MSNFVRQVTTGVAFAAIALAAVPAAAQDVSLGYQFQRFSAEDESITAPLGFNVDASVPVAGDLSVVGQFDWSRDSDSDTLLGTDFEFTTNFTSFAGGVRWNGRANPDFTPFVHALFGATRVSFDCEVAGTSCDDFGNDDDSSTDPMLQIGGGVAVPIGMGPWSALGQVDYRRIFAEDEGVNGFRFVIGVRLGVQ